MTICLAVQPSGPNPIGFPVFLSLYLPTYLPTQAVCCIPSLLQTGNVTMSAFTPLYQSSFLFSRFACYCCEFVPLLASFSKCLFEAHHSKNLSCLCKKSTGWIDSAVKLVFRHVRPLTIILLRKISHLFMGCGFEGITLCFSQPLNSPAIFNHV